MSSLIVTNLFVVQHNNNIEHIGDLNPMLAPVTIPFLWDYLLVPSLMDSEL